MRALAGALLLASCVLAATEPGSEAVPAAAEIEPQGSLAEHLERTKAIVHADRCWSPDVAVAASEGDEIAILTPSHGTHVTCPEGTTFSMTYSLNVKQSGDKDQTESVELLLDGKLVASMALDYAIEDGPTHTITVIRGPSIDPDRHVHVVEARVHNSSSRAEFHYATMPGAPPGCLWARSSSLGCTDPIACGGLAPREWHSPPDHGAYAHCAADKDPEACALAAILEEVAPEAGGAAIEIVPHNPHGRKPPCGSCGAAERRALRSAEARAEPRGEADLREALRALGAEEGAEVALVAVMGPRAFYTWSRLEEAQARARVVLVEWNPLVPHSEGWVAPRDLPPSPDPALQGAGLRALSQLGTDKGYVLAHASAHTPYTAVFVREDGAARLRASQHLEDPRRTAELVHFVPCRPRGAPPLEGLPWLSYADARAAANAAPPSQGAAWHKQNPRQRPDEL